MWGTRGRTARAHVMPVKVEPGNGSPGQLADGVAPQVAWPRTTGVAARRRKQARRREAY